MDQRIELPLVIDGREVTTGRLQAARMPHDHAHVLAEAHCAGRDEIAAAIGAAKRAAHDVYEPLRS